MPAENTTLRALTAQIVAAYLTKKPVDAPLDLKHLEASVYRALADCAGISGGGMTADGIPARPDLRRKREVRARHLAKRGKSTFRQRDVRAAIRASETAGKDVSGVEIDSNGTIKIVLGKPAVAETPGANEWDAVFK